MKLFSKFNRINLIATIAVFILSSVAFYFLLRFVLLEQVDENLEIEQQEVEIYAKKFGRLPEPIELKDQQITFAITSPPIAGSPKYKNYSNEEKEGIPYRKLAFITQVKEQWHLVTVSKSLEDTDTIFNSVILITAVTILLVLFVSILINRIVLKHLWKPFYLSLDMIRGFNLSMGTAPNFPTTNIEEFGAMNNTLTDAMNKAEKDYQLLKEFTENASHELQTPLAIIQSKLDILIQDEALSEKQGVVVQAINDALGKLSRMNKALLLLAKIENGQFAEKSQVFLQQKIEAKLIQIGSFYLDKNLIVMTNLNDISININPELCEILLNNLLGNAFRHTITGGIINVLLDSNSLTVENDGEKALSVADGLFTRFYKITSTSSGNGLGLSIIKQIADSSDYKIQYKYFNKKHQFILLF